MSHYETAEQRQIRELRNQITSMAREMLSSHKDNSALRDIINMIRQRQDNENARITQRIQQQQQIMQQQQAEINRRNAEIAQERNATRARMLELDREIKEKERLQNEKIQNMQTHYNQQIQTLNSQFQQVSAENQKTQEELHRTQNEMRTGFARIKEETDRKLRDTKAQIRNEIAQESARLESEISAVDSKVQALFTQIASEKEYSKELANYWIQEAERLIREMEETYRESLFDQRRMQMIRQKLDNARQDVSMGQPAIVPAREAFQDAMRMKEDLAELEMEWNYWYNILNNDEKQLIENLDSAENRVYVFNNDGEEIVYDNGIDYWTNGQLTIVHNRIDKLRAKMGDLQNATIDDLREYEEEMRSLIQELALVENASHINVAMSLSRYQTAVQIGEILGEEYQMEDSDGDFFREENREEYHAVYRNELTGDRVVVVITPIPDEAGVVQNHIELIADNGMDNDSDNRTMIHNIVSRKLRDSGIQDMHLESCAGRHGSRTQEVLNRAGDIQAVAAGDESVRVPVPQSQNGDSGIIRQISRTTK